MLIINYTKKEQKQYNTKEIIAYLSEYEISEKDLLFIADLQQTGELKELMLTKDNKEYDILTGDVEHNRIIIGGIRDDRAILSIYTVEKGKDKFLNLLNINSVLY